MTPESTRCTRYHPASLDRLETAPATEGVFVDDAGRLAVAFDGVAVRAALSPDALLLLAIRLGDLAVAQLTGTEAEAIGAAPSLGGLLATMEAAGRG